MFVLIPYCSALHKTSYTVKKQWYSPAIMLLIGMRIYPRIQPKRVVDRALLLCASSSLIYSGHHCDDCSLFPYSITFPSPLSLNIPVSVQHVIPPFPQPISANIMKELALPAPPILAPIPGRLSP